MQVAMSGSALARAADAMLQAMGAQQITLLFAGAGVAGDAAGELGLVDPGVEQVVVGPVAVRRLPTSNAGPRQRLEILVGRGAIEDELSLRNVPSGQALLESVLGVVYGGEMFDVEGVVAEQFAGQDYLYRVVVIE